MNKNSLHRLLNPEHIVFIGRSDLIKVAIENTQQLNFQGKISVVSEKHKTLAGLPCQNHLDEIQEPIDAAFVAVNAKASIEVIKNLANKNCQGAVCYAAGFAEMNKDGKQRQKELISAAKGMALIGPNCYGLINFTTGCALWPDHLIQQPSKKGVALICQSGNIALNLLMQQRSVPITHCISIGNQAVVNITDCIDNLLDEPRVTAIGLYIEGLSDIHSFSKVALKALRQGVPLVALKAGSSDIGRELTLTHTSSLAGSDQMYQALFHRLGILRVHSLSELLETCKLAASCLLPKGKKIGVLTCSGGDSAISADLIDHYNMTLPSLGVTQKNQLSQWLPDYANLSNPLDYNTAIWGDFASCEAVFRIFLDSNYDIGVLIIDFPHPEICNQNAWFTALEAFILAHVEIGKSAVVICNLPELLPQKAREMLQKSGIVPLQGMRDGFQALSNLSHYASYRSKIEKKNNFTHLVVRGNSQDNIIKDKVLDEPSSKAWLKKYGINTPENLVAGKKKIIEQSKQLNYPLVLKAISENLCHKTEAKGVVLNIKDDKKLVDEINAMSLRMEMQDIKIQKYLVESMIQNGIFEFIIGLKKDPQFGLVLVIGSGGILVNLINDSATLLLPTSYQEVSQAIEQLKCHTLIKGYRGQPEADKEALIEAILRVATMALENWDKILEVDINPLILKEKNQGVIAVDAMIRVTD